MLRLASLLCVFLLLAGCGGSALPAMTGEEPEPVYDSTLLEQSADKQPEVSVPPENPEEPREEYDRPEEEPVPPATADRRTGTVARGSLPSLPLSPDETLNYYFDLHYTSYTSLRPADMSRVLDFGEGNMLNLSVWLDMLIQRRRLIREMGLCYVEDLRFPYAIRFLEEEDLLDGRMEYWRDFDFEDGAELWLHFVIEGEPGRAYPPLMAAGAQHSVRMRKDGDGWKITFHYFPGARYKYYHVGWLNPVDDETMRAELLGEFGFFDDTDHHQPPVGAKIYDGRLAAEYAWRHTETPNPDYYLIDDWMGNCANFVSQCLAQGFSDEGATVREVQRAMTAQWYCGGGGGSPAWESVNAFWQFATGGGSMYSRLLKSAVQLRAGDVIQTRSIWNNEEGDEFNHSLIVVDTYTLKLGQNSPASFVYYSDLVGVRTRCIRPVYIS